MTEPSQAARSEGIPDTPPGYPTADPAAVERARTDRGLRLRLVRALWSRDELPTPYAQIGGYIYEIADRAAAEIEGRPPATRAYEPQCCELHNANCEPPSELCCQWCSEAAHPDHPPGVVCVLEQARAGEPLKALQEAEQHLSQILGTRWQPAPWETSSKSEFLRELSQLLQGIRDGLNQARRSKPETRAGEPMQASDREDLEQARRGKCLQHGGVFGFYHPECGFHWHGKDDVDVPIRDGEPVCPRCALEGQERADSREVLSEVRDLWEAWQKADQRRKTDVDNGVFDRAVIDAANRCRYRLERALGVEIPKAKVEAARVLGWEQT